MMAASRAAGLRVAVPVQLDRGLRNFEIPFSSLSPSPFDSDRPEQSRQKGE